MKDCGKEKEIDLLNKAIYGNGRAGLIETTARMSEKVDNIETEIEAIRADVKVLVRYQTQAQAIIVHKGGAKADKKWVFTSILAVIGLIAALLKDWFA